MRRLHYEFIEGRPAGHQWRVADDSDDVVTDFATEVEAQNYVQKNNERFDKENSTWRY